MNIATTQSGRAERIRSILKDLLKIIKVVSLYPADNPLPQSMKRAFAENLESTLDTTGDIELAVEKDHLTLGEETVFVDRSREESLAGLFFDAGVTTVRFQSGLDPNEIYRLLDIIKDYVNAPRHTFDFVNAVWESGLGNFQITTVDDVNLASYDDGFRIQEIDGQDTDRWRRKRGQDEAPQGYESIFVKDDSAEGGSGKIDFRAGADQTPSGGLAIFADNRAEEIALKTGDAAAAMGFADLPAESAKPDANLILNDQYVLTEEEQAHIRRLMAADAEFDMYESTAVLVKELLHQEDTLSEFNETAVICEKIIREFVQHRKLVEAGLMIDYLRVLEEQLTPEKPAWAQRLKDARITAGSHDDLAALTEVLNANADIGSDELRRYLNNLGWESLGSVIEMLGQLEHRGHRDSVCSFLSTRGKDNIGIVARGLSDKRWFVVRNAVVILAHIGGDEAVRYLRRVVGHEEVRVRLELVKALRSMSGDAVLDILKIAVKDTDIQVRQEAVGSIVARRGQAAFDAITEIINDDGFGVLALDEQQMLLTAYSIVGGEYALDYLSKLLLQPNLLRNQSLAALRVAAFHALAHNRSEKCEKLLLKLAGSWRPQIKELARKTIKERREIIYGGGDDIAG